MPVENYLLNVPDPTEQVLRGLQIGGTIRANREQRQKSEQLNKVLSSFGPETTLEEYQAAAPFLPPEQMKNILDLWDRKSDVQKDNDLQFTGQVLSAIRKSPETAVDLLNIRAEAERNSGNLDQAKALNAIANVTKEDPEAAFHMFATLSAFLPGAKEKLEGLGILGGEKRAEEGAPSIIAEREAGIAKTEAETAGLTWETFQSMDLHDILKSQEEAKVGNIKSETNLNFAKAEEAAGGGKIDNAALESELGNTFQKRVQSVRANIDQVSKIGFAAADNTGAGDLALIFAFMKMLDPGSVVRESEYARAAETQGLFRKIAQLGNKVKDGRFLDPGARKMIADLAKKLIQHSMAYGASQYQFTKTRAKNYGLDMENILPAADQIVFGRVATKYVEDEEKIDMAKVDKEITKILRMDPTEEMKNALIAPNIYFGDEEAPAEEQEASYMRFGGQ
ncbi:hypothetical protein KAR91_21355 [Candidatus Pacearchaeota archaeon]|nr:hypothetical protein [Candidatus Pacearchaeota archaeon]